MPKIKYQDFNFRTKTRDLIDQANEIIAEYAVQGFDLTLRQLYYQFVARDILPNTQKSYNNLGSIINDARLAGLIDWNAITDRTRNIRSVSHWPEPSSIIASAAASFRLDKWQDQPKRIEIWIEKDALVGVFERVAQRHDVGLFSCRGYVSQSEMWAAAQRMLAYERAGQRTTILHFGDHDPSGIDMTRDIQDRLTMFRAKTNVLRLALTQDQIDEYNPPPNPAKTTDSRYEDYQRLHGDESWELDALEPSVLAQLVDDNILVHRDEDAWNAAVEEEDRHRETLDKISDNYESVAEYVDGLE